MKLKNGLLLGAGLGTVLFLPRILNKLGLHPDFDGQEFDLEGRVLIITTSQSVLGDTGKATGVYASEMTVPYYQFVDAGLQVDIASIKGGKIPIEPSSLRYPIATPEDKRYLKDPIFKDKVANSFGIDELDFTTYDLIFMAGGWGAAYDLAQSEVLGQKITEANAKGIILGSVCHGALGFAQAKDLDGQPLVKNRKVTGVTNKQIKELRISITPKHPEEELLKLGADYQSEKSLIDVFSNLTVVDGNLVTGQNQNAGAEVAQEMMKLLLDFKK